MDKIDFKKQLKELYSAKLDNPSVVHIPKMQYLMIDGKGDPNTSQEYVDAIQTLYSVAYTIKFISKKDLGIDYGVMPLEGLWWAENMNDFISKDKNNWLWTAMIMTPDFITQSIFNRSIAQIEKKNNPKSLQKLRLENYTEGRAAQVLYIGPYSDEESTIQNLHKFIAKQGGTLSNTNMHHHEIYLSDPRRIHPSKLKTIIRQPF